MTATKKFSRSTTAMNRRHLMGSLGLGAGSMFLPSLLNRKQAQAATPPKRIVLMMSVFGHTPTDYNMRPAGNRGDNATWDVPLKDVPQSEFSRILKPFYPLRDKMVALEGLDMVSAKYETQKYPDVYHAGGIVNLVTGQWSEAGYVHPDNRGGKRDKARGISIDQLIASKLASPPRWRSIEIATAKKVLNGSGSYSFRSSGGAGMPAERDPGRLFDQLFPAGVGEGSDNPAPEPERPSIADRIRGQRKSVLDRTHSMYDAFSKRANLSGEDKQKLSLYRDFIRDLEGALQDYNGSLPLVPAGCSRPQRPSGIGATPQNGTQYDKHVDVMSRLATAAMACDQVRVVNMVLHGMPSDAFAVGSSTDDVHFKWAHKDRLDGNGKPRDANAYAQMGRYHIHHATKHVMPMAEMLNSIPEGNGTMLDNTLFVWWNEMARGHHTGEDYGAVLFGGRNLGINTGRYMHFAEKSVPAFKNYNGGTHSSIGLPTHHLLVSYAHAMGLKDINGIGFDKIESVPLTGPIPGLFL